MDRFAVLQLSGCAGCEVSLLNAEAWVDRHKLPYMPLVISAYDVPQVDVLLVSGGVRNDEDLCNLRARSGTSRPNERAWSWSIPSGGACFRPLHCLRDLIERELGAETRSGVSNDDSNERG